MNKGRPSRSKLTKSIPSLTHTLKLQQSLHLLQEHCRRGGINPMSENEHDINIVLQFLEQKLEISNLQLTRAANWRRRFFYNVGDTVPTFQNPVILLNESFGKVQDWVMNYAAEAISQVVEDELNYEEEDPDEIIDL